MRLSTIAATAIVTFIGITGDLALSDAAAHASAPATAAAAHSVTTTFPAAHHLVKRGQHADPFIMGH